MGGPGGRVAPRRPVNGLRLRVATAKPAGLKGHASSRLLGKVSENSRRPHPVHPLSPDSTGGADRTRVATHVRSGIRGSSRYRVWWYREHPVEGRDHDLKLGGEDQIETRKRGGWLLNNPLDEQGARLRAGGAQPARARGAAAAPGARARAAGRARGGASPREVDGSREVHRARGPAGSQRGALLPRPRREPAGTPAHRVHADGRVGLSGVQPGFEELRRER
jgi:hypothetical protein